MVYIDGRGKSHTQSRIQTEVVLSGYMYNSDSREMDFLKNGMQSVGRHNIPYTMYQIIPEVLFSHTPEQAWSFCIGEYSQHRSATYSYNG